ncbi:hypothetical protein DLH72_00075 [Candidatus Gracilibacteria bacterium]|nr:MAG: hypothetical protein DLH72_00075 [Candidatus Gracilibacteria bacterium]
MNTAKKIKLIDFKLSKSVGNLLFGLYKSKFHGSGINFYEHREYVFGEAVKNIDWKSSSKTSKIYSKIFEEEKELNVLFVLDINSSMLFSSGYKSKKDLLQEVFYSLAFSSYKNSDNFGILLYDGKKNLNFPYKKDFSNIFKTIEEIENIKFSENIEKNKTIKILEYLVKLKTKDNLIFILTDDILDVYDNNLKILGLRNELIFINIFDYFENNLESFGQDFTLNSGKNFLNIYSQIKKIKKYNALRAVRIENFKKILKKYKIGYIYTDTKKDVFKELSIYFSKI